MSSKPKKKKSIEPKLRFPEFKGAWNVPTLGEVSDRITEKVGTKSLKTISISAGIGFVSQAKKFSRDISGEQYKNYIVLNEGDFSYNKGNSKRFPQGCVYKLTEFKQVAAPNVFFSFKFKSNYVADFYQGYFANNFHGEQLKKFIASGARNNGLLNISADDFFSIKLPTPVDRKEQQKIADFLLSLDELIEAENQKLDALQRHKKGLMQELFPTENETIPQRRFPEFKGSPVWQEDRLGDYIEEFRQKSNSQDEYEVLTSARGGLIRQREYYDNNSITERDNIGFHIVPPNYITYRSRSDDGLFFFNLNNLGITGVISIYYPVFKIIKGDNAFFTYLFSWYAETIGKNSVGNAQKVLSLNELRKIVLPIPSPEEQQKIASILSSVDDLITKQSQKIETLRAHKKGLTQQLFPAVSEVQ